MTNRFIIWRAWVGLAALLLWLGWTTPAHAALGDGVQWIFLDEGKPGAPPARGSWVATTETAPTEVAARFTLSSTMQSLALHLASPELNGVRLVDLNTLDYCTRLVEGNRPDAVMLQLSVDVDVTDTDYAWQGRLVYVPAHNGAVVQGEWQCWRTLGGKWWATSGALAELAPADSPQPLGVLIARYPNLGLHPDVSPIVLKAGDGWNPFVGEAGPVMVGSGGARTIYAFGPADTPDQTWVPVVMQQPVAQPADAAAPTPTPMPDTVNVEDEQDAARNRGDNGDRDDDDGKDDKDGKKDKKDKDKKDKDKKDKEKKDKKEKRDKDEKKNRGDDNRGNDDNQDRRAQVDACRADGWSSLGFRNQGQCVASYNRADHRDRD